jgi:poly-gamma-glutamate synthesis protein (capsule biosynthesis protein)
MEKKIDFETLTFSGDSDSSEKSLCINIAGDFAPISGNTSEVLIEKKEKYYGDLLRYFTPEAVNIINLETVIDDISATFEYPKKFIEQKEIVHSLKISNITLCTLANNHIMDNGIKGVENTISLLKANRIASVGAGQGKSAYEPWIYRKDNNRIAVFNAAEGELANEKYNNGNGAADIESYVLIDRIREYKKENYFVILILHAGEEFVPVPPPHIQKLYRNFVDEGCDLVAGHHPHVTQGVELYKNKPIFYSLGHFSLYRKYSRQKEKESFFLNLHICDNNIQHIEIIPFHIHQDRLELMRGKAWEEFRKNLEKISRILKNDKKVAAIWNLYAGSRKPILDIKNIFFSYMSDYNKCRYLIKNNQVNLTRRHRYLSDGEHVEDAEELFELLHKYGAVRKLSLSDKLFLKMKNIFFIFSFLMVRTISMSKRIINR